MNIIFLGAMLRKLCVLMLDFAYQLSFTEEKIQSIKLLKQFFESRVISKNNKKAFS